MSEVSDLEALCEYAQRISSATTDRDTDWRGQRVSVVFIRLCTTCISFLKLVPESTYFSTTKEMHLWDIPSAASLCRNLIEAYYVMTYLLTDLGSEEANQCGIKLWNYHKAFEQHKMLSVGVPSSKHLDQVSAEKQKCHDDLKSNTFFNNLSSKQKKRLVEGRDFQLLSKQSLNELVGINHAYYAFTYKYLCTYTHTSPFAVSQLNPFLAGTPKSIQMYASLIGPCTAYTALAIREFLDFMPDQKASLTQEIVKIVSKWQEILSNWDNPEWRMEAP